METHEIGSRRELFVDDCLIGRMSDGAELRLHHPVPREVAFVTDEPWEGSQCTNFTVFRDGDIYRMYYLAWDLDLENSSGWGDGLSTPHDMWMCYAESDDGLNWRKPELGLVEHEGSRANNIVWRGVGPEQHGLKASAVFRDTHPDCAPGARYKAVGSDRRSCQGHLYALGSPDGIHWSLLSEEPILRQGRDGKFDSQNLAFWDEMLGEYRIYVRQTGPAGREIATATSGDFLHWTETELLSYPGAPEEQLYINQIRPYYRAPHIYLGFPARYLEREWSPAIEDLPEPEHRRMRSDVHERYGTALTDGLFMSSRDGRTFRRWGEAFIRPGPQLTGNWAYSDNYQCWGMYETPSALEGAPPELSFYATEGKWRGDAMWLRRYTIRIDGFVSLHAPRRGAEVLTDPLTFEGDRLELNFATSAAGSIRVEIRNADGSPIDGFALEDCHEVIGDELDRAVRWKDDPHLADLSERPIRLRFVMEDADLYSFRFREE